MVYPPKTATMQADIRWNWSVGDKDKTCAYMPYYFDHQEEQPCIIFDGI